MAKFGRFLKRTYRTALGTNRANNEYRQMGPELGEQSGAAGSFAGVGETGYANRGTALDQQADYLGRLQRGEDSLSAEQLRQGLQQNLAAQQAFAQAARPSNVALAGRTAAIQSARLGAGLAGQQAMAGIAERQAAAQALSNLQLQARQQDMQTALQSRNNAIGGYGQQEAIRANRFNSLSQSPTAGEQWLGFFKDNIKAGMGMAGGGAGAGGGGMASDRALKTNIAPGDRDTEQFMNGLRSYKYDYKPGADPGVDVGDGKIIPWRYRHNTRPEGDLGFEVDIGQPRVAGSREELRSKRASDELFRRQIENARLENDPEFLANRKASRNLFRVSSVPAMSPASYSKLQAAALSPEYDVEIGKARVGPRTPPTSPQTYDRLRAEYGVPSRVGIMAQDLEKSPLGKSMVVNTPSGKVVDKTRLLSATTAGLANVNDRLRELEAKLGRKR